MSARQRHKHHLVMSRAARLIVVGVSGFLFLPNTAQAVIPPDFVFNLGAQVAQWFSIIALLISTIFGTAWLFFKNRFAGLKHKKLFFTMVLCSMLVVALITAYVYALHQQNLVYENYFQ